MSNPFLTGGAPSPSSPPSTNPFTAEMTATSPDSPGSPHNPFLNNVSTSTPQTSGGGKPKRLTMAEEAERVTAFQAKKQQSRQTAVEDTDYVAVRSLHQVSPKQIPAKSPARVAVEKVKENDNDSGDEQEDLSYIEMMCSSPRWDNAEARSILADGSDSSGSTANTSSSPNKSQSAESKATSPSGPKTLRERQKAAAAAAKPGQTGQDVQSKAAQAAGQKNLRVNNQGDTPKPRKASMKDEAEAVARFQAKKIESMRLALFRCVHEGADESNVDLSAYMRLVLGIPGSVPGVAITQYAMKGYLTKEGGIRKNWLERWFVLDLNCGTLAYYSDMKLTQMKGGAKLSDINYAVHQHSDTEKGKRQFSVVSAERTYNLMAESVLTMNAWIQAINSITTAATGGDAPDRGS